MNTRYTSGLAVPAPIDRLESVQMLRGVAAMAVVYHHIGFFITLDPALDLGESLLLPSKVVAQMGATGVDLFFVISGFVMALSAGRFVGPAGAGVFLAQRFIRIAPLFYLACLVMLAEMLRADLPIDPTSVLNSITFIPVFDDESYSWPLHYLGWTLALEFVFYLFVAALISSGMGGRHGLLLAIVLCMPLLGLAFEARPMLWKAFTNPLLWEFALGVLACILWERGWLRRLRVPMAVALGVALIAGLPALWQVPERLAEIGSDSMGGAYNGARALYWGVPAFLFFCVAVGYSGSSTRPAARLLKLLGDASYSIYLSHLFVVMAVGVVLKRLPVQADLVVVGTLVLSAVVGVITYRLAEKPMLTAGQRSIRTWASLHMRVARG